MASTETLHYYGAQLLETSQERVSLQSRHVLQDFTYSPDYLQSFVMRERPTGGGGAALEHHDFAHLDCPLTAMEDSGHFVIAKFLDEEKTKIAITGFQVDEELLTLIKYLFHILRFQRSTLSTPRLMCCTPTTTSEAPGGRCSPISLSTRENWRGTRSLSASLSTPTFHETV